MYDRTTKEYLILREKLVCKLRDNFLIDINSLLKEYESKNDVLKAHLRKYVNLNGETVVQKMELEEKNEERSRNLI